MGSGEERRPASRAVQCQWRSAKPVAIPATHAPCVSFAHCPWGLLCAMAYVYDRVNSRGSRPVSAARASTPQTAQALRKFRLAQYAHSPLPNPLTCTRARVNGASARVKPPGLARWKCPVQGACTLVVPGALSSAQYWSSKACGNILGASSDEIKSIRNTEVHWRPRRQGMPAHRDASPCSATSVRAV